MKGGQECSGRNPPLTEEITSPIAITYRQRLFLNFLKDTNFQAFKKRQAAEKKLINKV